MREMAYIIQNLNFAAPYPGNLMRSIWNLELRCREKSIIIIYCFPDIAKNIPWVENMISNGKIVHFKPSKPNVNFWRNIINLYKPIAVHTHFWNIRDSLTLQLASFFNKKTRLILHHHNTYFKSKKTWKEILKRLIIRSDIHIACGLALGEDLKKKGIKNTITVENAIDFSRMEDYMILNRKEFGISDKAIVFLMFGFPIHRKGVDIAIKALNDFVKDNKDEEAVLCIVVADGLEKAKQTLVDEFGYIPSWVIFLPPRDDIATYYQFADVFLSPSREEGFCYALPEATYSGCKLVFSDIPGQAHAIDIPNAYHFESEKIESMKAQIETAIHNEVTNTAQEYVRSRYDLSKWSESIIDIYVNFRDQ